MNKLVNEIKVASQDRLKNPFVFSFIFSWIAFNWKGIIYLILSTEDVKERISTIGTDYTLICNTLFFPLLIAVFYTVILPYINWGFDLLIKTAEIKRNEISAKKKVKKLEAELDVAIAESNLTDKRTDYKTKENLKAEIELLKGTISTKDEKINQINTENEELKKSRNEERKKNKTDIESLKNELYGNPNYFSGDHTLSVNISVKQRDHFFQLVKNRFSLLDSNSHQNKVKTDYFTVIFNEVSEDFRKQFEIMLIRNDIDYIDFSFTR